MKKTLKKITVVVIVCLAITQNADAQTLVKGTVKSEPEGLALAGVTISARNSKTNTVSAADGSFAIAIKTFPDTLSIRYNGRIQQTAVINRSNYANPLNISMIPSSTLLEEVTISNGYQIIPKERSTGSFDVIGKKLLNEQVGANILDRLPAIASGLTFDRATNATGKLMVRGLSTISGPKDPLIILNNFPYEGNLNNINPNDVESITILKDAAAASIWGARAGNGVIVITTKMSAKGQPLSVEFNSNLTLGTKPDLSYLKQMSSSDFIDIEEKLYNNGYYTSQINASNRPLLSPVVELLIKRQTANDADKQKINAQIDVLKNQDIRNDFNKYVYDDAIAQQYSLSLRGSSQLHSWLVSGGFDKTKSNLDALSSRGTLKFDNNFFFTDKLSLTTSLDYTRANNISGKQGYGEVSVKANSIYPYARFVDDQGLPVPFAKEYRQSYTQNLTNAGLLNWNYLPLEDYKYAYTDQKLTDILINTALKYKFTSWLNASVQYQSEVQSSVLSSWQKEQSWATRNQINLYTVINADGTLTRNIPRGDILDLTKAQLNSNQIRGQLNLDKHWDKHNLTALAGAEVRSLVSESNTFRTYGYNPENLAIGNVDLTKTYPLITGGSNFIADNKYFTHTENRNLSFFSNLAYTYLNRYTFTASARRDASNLYGVTTNNKWNPLWSAGLSWYLSKEKFFKSTVVDDLKIRSTFGYSGNTDPARTAVTTLYALITSPYTLSVYNNIDQVANPSLKWETVRQINTGFDFGLFNSRITGSFDYYLKKGEDLFGSVPVDYTTGVGFTLTKNVASIKGKGYDIVLNTLNTNGLLKWSSNINFSHHDDKVVDYTPANLQASNFVNTGLPRFSGLPGNSIYAIYAYKWGGLDPLDGQPQGYLNGALSKNYRSIVGASTSVNDLVYYGSGLPTYYGSVGNTLTWNNFSLTARVIFKLGYYFRRPTIDYSSLYTSWTGNSDYAKRWKAPGDENRTDIAPEVYPLPSSLGTFYSNTEPFVTKGDHIRLQYISIDYAVLKKNSKLPFKTLNVYANANNLGILWRANNQQIDPDYAQNNRIPQSKTYAVGLRATY